MVGPVLYQELLLGSRGGKQHVFRWVYAGWLVVQILFFAFVYAMTFFKPANSHATADVAAQFVQVFVPQQLIVMLIAVPAFAAGAVTDEKTRGTMQYLLTTDLESVHIIVGKLLARTAQVLILVLTGLPLFCFLGCVVGMRPMTLLGVTAVTVLPLLALGSATMLASVWCRQTRDAVLGLYTVGLAGFIAVWWLGGPLDYLDPRFVLEPVWGNPTRHDLREFGRRLSGAGMAWGIVALVCLGLAVWRLRPAYRKQLEGEGKKAKLRWWRAERLEVPEEPVAWKEQHVEGLAPLRAFRGFPRWLALTLVAGGTALSSFFLVWLNLVPGKTLEDVFRAAASFELLDIPSYIAPGAADAFMLQGMVALLLASLVVGIRCSGAVCGEREKQTWEALLLTPLTARQLIRGKLWGIMGASYWYLLAYALPALAFAALCGGIALFWTILLLAVTLLAMYFMGAAGLYCSVRCMSSWRSLLWTLGVGYVGGFLVYVCTTPVLLVLAIFVLLLLYVIERGLGISFAPTTAGGIGLYLVAFLIVSCLGLALAFWLTAKYFFLTAAQRWVADRERTRYWKDEPVYHRPRYRPVRAAGPR